MLHQASTGKGQFRWRIPRESLPSNVQKERKASAKSFKPDAITAIALYMTKHSQQELDELSNGPIVSTIEHNT